VISVEPIGPDDLSLAAGWLSNGAINRWLTSDFRGKSITPSMLAIMLRNKRNRLLLVREDGQPCGLVGFADLDEIDKVCMIWYVLGDRERGGRGLTSRAVEASLAVAFTDYGMENVYAWIIEDNAPSCRVLEKNGFRRMGRMRGATRSGEQRVDRIYFDITRSDFEELSSGSP
jgi:RimJ/RimL family protein N-acetyltransferase